MAEAIGDETDPVAAPAAQQLSEAVAALADRPEAFDLYAAARLLQAAHPDKPRIGRSTRIEQDFVRFAQEPTLSFQASQIAGFAPRDGDGPQLLKSYVFGLFGPNGALPMQMTEDALHERVGGRSGATAEFVDIFHHRLISLLYRAWETTQIAVSRDRPGQDPYEGWLNAFSGAEPLAMRNRDALPDDLRRRLSGWFSSGPKSAAGLAAVAEEVIGVKVAIEEFRGEWLAIAPDQRARLGGSAMGLGTDIVVGDRYFSLQSRLRIRTGRLNIDQYRALLPGAPIFARLRDAARAYLGLAIGWEVQLVLDSDDVPPLRLARADETPLRLGYETWLTDETPMRDAEDLVLEGAYAGTG